MSGVTRTRPALFGGGWIIIATEMDWITANAEQLPLEDNTFDAYTIAFGIRNCTNVDRVLAEAYRVLKPGGRFMCLEFSHVQQPIIRRYETRVVCVVWMVAHLLCGG